MVSLAHEKHRLPTCEHKCWCFIGEYSFHRHGNTLEGMNCNGLMPLSGFLAGLSSLLHTEL